MFVDGEFGGIEASTSAGFYELKARWFWIEVLGEILVKSPDTSAVLPSGGNIPSRRASWLPFVHFSLYEGKP
jgi:hypothetical protein